MKIFNSLIKINTKKTLDFIDITDRVQDLVIKAKIRSGLINIQSLHTTMAIIVNEAEPLLISDMRKILERIAPKNINYQHDNFAIRTVNMCDGECRNGHSHCKAIFLSTSQPFNIFQGKLQLGQWQRIFAVELDRPRSRKIAIQIIGKSI